MDPRRFRGGRARFTKKKRKKEKNTLIHYYGSHGARTEILEELHRRQSRAVIRRRTGGGKGRAGTHYANLSFNLAAPPVRLLFSFGEGDCQPA